MSAPCLPAWQAGRSAPLSHVSLMAERRRGLRLLCDEEERGAERARADFRDAFRSRASPEGATT